MLGEERIHSERDFGQVARALVVQNELGDATIQRAYIPLGDELLRTEEEGVDRGFPFDWKVRNAEVAPEMNETIVCDILDGETVMKPVNRAHMDDSAGGVPDMVRNMLGNDADSLLRGRVRIMRQFFDTTKECNGRLTSGFLRC